MSYQNFTQLRMRSRMLAARVKESTRKQTRAKRRGMCPHCDQHLEVKTLRKHKSLFQKSDGTWIRIKDCHRVSEHDQEATSFEAESEPVPVKIVGECTAEEDICCADACQHTLYIATKHCTS